jgi:hypothetical protein
MTGEGRHDIHKDTARAKLLPIRRNDEAALG